MSLPVPGPTQRASDSKVVDVGTVLRGKWHLDSRIGTGGTAEVFAATHRNGSRAAVKVLHAHLAKDAGARARLRQEGRIMNSVGHHGTVLALDDDEAESGQPYLVLELLDGITLRQHWLDRGRTLPLREMLELACAGLGILTAVHEAGVVHRDLKPENFFLQRRGGLKLIDFGVAHFPAPDAWELESGDTMGTPAFMSPEQARGEWSRVDARADLFSFGAMLFTLLTGKLVHEGASLAAMLLSSVTKPCTRLAECMPDAPSEVAALIDGALDFDPSRRWGSAARMLEVARLAYAAVSSRSQSNAVRMRAMTWNPAHAPRPPGSAEGLLV